MVFSFQLILQGYVILKRNRTNIAVSISFTL